MSSTLPGTEKSENRITRLIRSGNLDAIREERDALEGRLNYWWGKRPETISDRLFIARLREYEALCRAVGDT